LSAPRYPAVLKLYLARRELDQILLYSPETLPKGRDSQGDL